MTFVVLIVYFDIVLLKRFGSLLFQLHLMFMLCTVLNIIDSYGLKTVCTTLMPDFVPNKQAAPNMRIETADLKIPFISL